jgi:hypothetical protein
MTELDQETVEKVEAIKMWIDSDIFEYLNDKEKKLSETDYTIFTACFVAAMEELVSDLRYQLQEYVEEKKEEGENETN